MTRSTPLDSLRAGLATLAMVAVSTLAGLWVAPRWGSASVDLLFLPAVLAAAALFGRWPALLAAVLSALAYNYFHVAPVHSFRIDRPEDVLTVIVLLAVAIVVSQLAASMRTQARLAFANARRNATIAGLARRLLSCAGEDEIATVAVSELSQLFRCNAVLAVGPDAPRILASAPGPVELAPSDFAAAAATMATGEVVGRGVRRASLADWQFHPVTPAGVTVAAVGLAREDGVPPVEADRLALLGNLLDQVALALERARLEREAREVATLRERDKLRSTLLASIGEDVKPRLNALAAAARALKRFGLADKAVVAGIAAEVGKLDRYIDYLVDLSPGAEQEPLQIGPLTIDLHRRAVRRNGVEVHLTPKEYAVLAELAKHSGRVLTHRHLLRAVWGPAQAEQIDYLRVAIGAIRHKLEADPAHPELIVNEPAIGYRLAAPAI